MNDVNVEKSNEESFDVYLDSITFTEGMKVSLSFHLFNTYNKFGLESARPNYSFLEQFSVINY